MVRQYPHYLFVRTSAGESIQDENGNWIAAADAWTLHSMCREETNGKGQSVNGVDGKAIVYSSTIYMPLATGAIKEGTEVVVTATNNVSDVVRIKGQVLKFEVGQLNRRLWV